MASSEPGPPVPIAGSGVAEPRTMRSRVLHGVAWKAASQVVLQGSKFVVAIILARLLTPRDYGLAAMVLVVSSFGLAFTDLALGAALVQRRTLSEGDRSTVFWTSVGLGAAFTLGGIALAGPLAEFYDEPDVRPLMMVLSLLFFITSLGITHAALLTREMNFRALELRLMIAQLVGATLGITLALKGFGAVSIIAVQLGAATVSTLLVWLWSPWHPRFTYSVQSLRSLVNFSGSVFTANFLFHLNRNVDNMLIGRFLGPAALGAYALAYNVMLVPFRGIAAPIRDVMFPAFSRMQDDRARLAAIWLRANRVLAGIITPALLGVVVVAPDFVNVVLGERWSAAIPIIQILGWVGILQSTQSLNGSVLQACGRAGTLLRFALISFPATITAFVIGLHWGIVGVATGYAIVTSAIQPLNTWVTARAVGIRPSTFIRSLARVIEASLVMFAVTLAFRYLLVRAGVDPAVRLVLVSGAGVVVYCAWAAWRAPDLREEVTSVLSRRARPGLVEPVG